MEKMELYHIHKNNNHNLRPNAQAAGGTGGDTHRCNGRSRFIQSIDEADRRGQVDDYGTGDGKSGDNARNGHGIQNLSLRNGSLENRNGTLASGS